MQRFLVCFAFYQVFHSLLCRAAEGIRPGASKREHQGWCGMGGDRVRNGDLDRPKQAVSGPNFLKA